MIPLTLPRRPDRPLLLSFWLALCVCGWAILTSISLVFASRTLGLPGAVILVVSAMTGYFRGGLVLRTYRLWNRAARKAAGIAEQATLRVCYYLVLSPVGAAGGSRVPLRAPLRSASGWMANGALGKAVGPATLTPQPHDRVRLRGDVHWVSELVRRSVDSKNVWRLILIPHLMLLRCFDSSRSDPVALGNNYTLY